MVRWMSGLSLKQHNTNDELRKRMSRAYRSTQGARERIMWYRMDMWIG